MSARSFAETDYAELLDAPVSEVERFAAGQSRDQVQPTLRMRTDRHDAWGLTAAEALRLRKSTTRRFRAVRKARHVGGRVAHALMLR